MFTLYICNLTLHAIIFYLITGKYINPLACIVNLQDITCVKSDTLTHFTIDIDNIVHAHNKKMRPREAHSVG